MMGIRVEKKRRYGLKIRNRLRKKAMRIVWMDGAVVCKKLKEGEKVILNSKMILNAIVCNFPLYEMIWTCRSGESGWSKYFRPCVKMNTHFVLSFIVFFYVVWCYCSCSYSYIVSVILVLFLHLLSSAVFIMVAFSFSYSSYA